jgi:2-polyprenyl-6-methoxyphenol hydroxylase-like FAD-dependent oxidoreductase
MNTATNRNGMGGFVTASAIQQFTQPPLSRRNVLIVGGGPAGLAAALMLAKRGWTEITVLEKRRAADYYEPDKSFNYLIDARGQKFTDLLGLTEQLSAIGVPITEFRITRIQPNGSRKTLKRPLNDPKPAYWVFRRAFLQLLYQEIKQNWSAHITVLFNTQCIAINKIIKNGSETLEVIAEVENPSLQQRFEPNLLIGCDGIQSLVRSTLNTWERSGKFEIQQFPSPSSGLRYKVLSLPPNFPLDAQGKEQAVSTLSYGVLGKFRERRRSLSLALLPIKDPQASRTAMFVNRTDHQLWQLKTGEALLSFLENAFPQLPLRQIVSPEEADRFANSDGGSFPIPQFCSGLHYLLHNMDAQEAQLSEMTASGVTRKQDKVDKPSHYNHSTRNEGSPIQGLSTLSGNYVGVLLLGDAIHCFPPDIGQGVNAALEDVFVLHQVLAQNEDDLSRSLPRYEAVRSPDVEAIVRLAQIAAPWQYNQAPLRARLWLIGYVIRSGLSKALPNVSPPAAFLIRNHQLSYQEIWLSEQRTTRILCVSTWIGFTGLLGIAALLLN